MQGQASRYFYKGTLGIAKHPEQGVSTSHIGGGAAAHGISALGSCCHLQAKSGTASLEAAFRSEAGGCDTPAVPPSLPVTRG